MGWFLVTLQTFTRTTVFSLFVRIQISTSPVFLIRRSFSEVLCLRTKVSVAQLALHCSTHFYSKKNWLNFGLKSVLLKKLRSMHKVQNFQVRTSKQVAFYLARNHHPLWYFWLTVDILIFGTQINIYSTKLNVEKIYHKPLIYY